jgi:hypothetical protein
MTLTEWRQLILLKLGLDIPFTLKWYDKLCDFKSTFGHLFSDLMI